jgi:class 3 adenylate cyclase
MAIIGEKVNLAARLMGICPARTVVCDTATFNTTCGRVSYDPLPAVTLKGISFGESIRCISHCQQKS